MKVPLLDLTRVSDQQMAELHAVAARVLDSGRYVLGPELSAFEAECADYMGTPHALGVSSGTDALLVALMALDVGAGDEVICPTYTFFATAGTIWRTGARPVFVDSDQDTLNCSVADIERKLTDRTKAIMPVHLFGQCADMAAILTLAEERGLPVIEDAAQAIGADCDAGRAGAMGAVGCFSFFPTKNLGGFGEGGLVTTHDEGLHQRMQRLRVHGMEPKYHHGEVGGNFRMQELQAALLRVQLRNLDAATAGRQRNAAFYDQAFADAGVAIGVPRSVTVRHTYNQYVIRVPKGVDRDDVRQKLTAAGVGNEVYYPIPMHLQECFQCLGGKAGDFPVAEQAARETIALPIFPALTEAELAYVAAQVVEAC
ncbi:MAG: DegT/DnrJ/EryC1/StrS family aminotransferase [Planctomycetota bacterium]